MTATRIKMKLILLIPLLGILICSTKSLQLKSQRIRRVMGKLSQSAIRFSPAPLSIALNAVEEKDYRDDRGSVMSNGKDGSDSLASAVATKKFRKGCVKNEIQSFPFHTCTTFAFVFVFVSISVCLSVCQRLFCANSTAPGFLRCSQKGQ